jgi:hypothetical protein
MNKAFIKGAFMISLLFLFFPMLNQVFNLVKVPTLKGYIKSPDDTTFSINTWISGLYQDKAEEKIKHDLRFRPFLIRFNNQLNYTLFHEEINAFECIIGKDGYLFEEGYIKAYLGLNYKGDECIRKKISQLKMVRDTLLTANTELFVFLAPGKATFMPEKIPEQYDLSLKDTNNYQVTVHYLKNYRIPYINGNKWFSHLKKHFPYPLYTKGGIHWSDIGSYIALDSFIKFSENLLHTDLTDYTFSELEFSTIPRFVDNDLGDAANLLFYKHEDTLAYITMKIEEDQEKPRPRILVVADSYYWNIFNKGVVHRIFAENSQFWYYCNDIHPCAKDGYSKVEEIEDFAEYIQKMDIIMLLSTDGTLHGFFWGFIEKAYASFYTPNDTVLVKENDCK